MDTTSPIETILTFKMAPSDPDFPFEMPFLECVLHIPSGYPTIGIPRLDVKNRDMGRGYQINVEKGFETIVLQNSQSTLLAYMNSLDKQLESLLSSEKAETIKLVSNSGVPTKPVNRESSTTANQPKPSAVRKEPTYSVEQLATAASRRQQETRQLESRLGRQPLFVKSSDGLSFTLPIEPSKRDELPMSLHAVKTVVLIVPMLYPLAPHRIELQGVTKDAARNIEKSFGKKAKQNPDLNLMGHVNYLTQNMHILAAEEHKDEQVEMPEVKKLSVEENHTSAPTPAGPRQNESDDRPHIQYITRPPEWDVKEGSGEDSDISFYDSEEELSEDYSETEQLETVPESATTVQEKGVSLSFPFLEFHGIEILELTSLSVTVKCERCKDTLDVKNVRDSDQTPTGIRTESCKKCASTLGIGMAHSYVA